MLIKDGSCKEFPFGYSKKITLLVIPTERFLKKTKHQNSLTSISTTIKNSSKLLKEIWLGRGSKLKDGSSIV